MKLVLALIFAAGSAAAQEFITTDAPLSDTDFYRLVSCAAPLGGDCQKELVRWSPADAQDVSIGIVQVEDGYPAYVVQLASDALNSAISELNAVDANLHITLSDNSIRPDIGIHLLTIVEGDAIRNTGLDPLDGETIEAAKAQLWWRNDLSLIEGAIVFGKDISPDDLQSIMLEEVTQSMGLLTDIGGPYYQTRSIFSESSNQLTALGPQDVMALRRHYPKSP
jgi:hypothetical protein